MQFHLRTVPSTWSSLNVTEPSFQYTLYHRVPFKNCTVNLMLFKSYRAFSPIYIFHHPILFKSSTVHLKLFNFTETFSSLYNVSSRSINICTVHLMLSKIYRNLQSDIYFIINFHLRNVLFTCYSLNVTENSVGYILCHAFPLRILPSTWGFLIVTEPSVRYLLYYAVPLSTVLFSWCPLNVTELSVLYILYHAIPFKNSNVHLMLSNMYRSLQSDIYFIMQFHLKFTPSTWCFLKVTEAFSPIYIVSCSSI